MFLSYEQCGLHLQISPARESIHFINGELYGDVDHGDQCKKNDDQSM
jgi:hypothetical protein